MKTYTTQTGGVYQETQHTDILQNMNRSDQRLRLEGSSDGDVWIIEDLYMDKSRPHWKPSRVKVQPVECNVIETHVDLLRFSPSNVDISA